MRSTHLILAIVLCTAGVGLGSPSFALEPVLVKGMMPGDRISHRTDVRAVKLNRPSQQKSSGYLETDVTYMGRMRVNTPAGKFDSYLIRRDIRSNVTPVKQSDTIYVFIASGINVCQL